MSLILLMPSKCTVFFIPSAYNLYFQTSQKIISKHWLITNQAVSASFFIWFSQILQAKHINYNFAELVHWHEECGLTHSHVLIQQITWCSMWKHSNSCSLSHSIGGKKSKQTPAATTTIGGWRKRWQGERGGSKTKNRFKRISVCLCRRVGQ